MRVADCQFSAVDPLPIEFEFVLNLNFYFLKVSASTSISISTPIFVSNSKQHQNHFWTMLTFFVALVSAVLVQAASNSTVCPGKTSGEFRLAAGGEL